jgi:hypothetical protein
MIQPPEHLSESQKHLYYIMLGEIIGKKNIHDEYCEIAGWMITKISTDNPEFVY